MQVLVRCYCCWPKSVNLANITISGVGCGVGGKYTWQSCATGRASGSDGECTFTIFCFNESDFADGGTSGGGTVYGGGILVDGRSSSGTHEIGSCRL